MQDSFDISLTVYRENEYKCRIICILPDITISFVRDIGDEVLTSKLEAVNDTLGDILNQNKADNENNDGIDESDQFNEYRTQLDIPLELCKDDLKKIADLNLFDLIFGPEYGNQFKQEVRKFANARGNPLLNIKIMATNFRFPWCLLYEKDIPESSEDVDEKYFWGFRYIITQSPKVARHNLVLDVSDSSGLSFNMNNSIDSDPIVKDFYKETGTPIEEQRKILNSIKASTIDGSHLQIREYTQKREVKSLLVSNPIDAIIYFFCHAKYEPFNSKSAELSYIELSESTGLTDIGKRDKYRNKITLQELRNKITLLTHFVSSPLIFINACESGAESSFESNFVESFRSLFLDHGASGFVGCLAKVPPIFASKFAVEFFKLLFTGKSIDRIIFELRNMFLEKNHNILGLYYDSSCMPNLSIKPILKNSFIKDQPIL